MNIKDIRRFSETPIVLRPEEPTDEPLVFDLYASTREEELAMTGWDDAARAAFLSMQFRAMRQGYASMFPRGQFSIILRDGKPAGRLVVDRTGDEIHVVDIVISPAQRGQGIGARIIKALVEEARQSQKPVRLQVFKNSRAIAFYQRLGFSRTSETDLYEQLECRP
jgi:ribosomal protein S18 acetylase RimI-like enzyme